ncbi:MAG: peptide-modifying radical SAM enzyme CbpB [bacterium]|nr:peptide-modifying radical SAM enzyme CbpB [bacterium]
MNIKASSSGRFSNTGNGYNLNLIDIDHPDYMAAIEPDIAYWSLILKDKISELYKSSNIVSTLEKHYSKMQDEMNTLRFNLKPSTVYFNPTEKCNLNCPYCYIPETIRKDGYNMPYEKLDEALIKLQQFFTSTLAEGQKPNIVFHGSEPMINKENVFKIISKYNHYFNFGIQTNGTLLEKSDIEFIKNNGVVIGLSLDGHSSAVSNKTRRSWHNEGTFDQIIKVLNEFNGYSKLSVITTVTNHNINDLPDIVEFLHQHKVNNCLLNQVRCTLQGARDIKPDDALMAKMFTRALDRSYELYQESNRKIIIVNFANIILSIVAPTARKLMCDISPCGGGRCFFAVSSKGEMFPCSEFIGLQEFNGGNLFNDNIDNVLKSSAFNLVTERKVEDIEPCNKCVIRHFCGSPCPAEAHNMNGSMKEPGAFCEFYEEQVRYAFRLIADQKNNAFLWDNWDDEIIDMF